MLFILYHEMQQQGTEEMSDLGCTPRKKPQQMVGQNQKNLRLQSLKATDHEGGVMFKRRICKLSSADAQRQPCPPEKKSKFLIQQRC